MKRFEGLNFYNYFPWQLVVSHKAVLSVFFTMIISGTALANSIPVVSAIPAIETNEDVPYKHLLVGNDAEDDKLTWRLKAGSPAWLSIGRADGMLSRFAGIDRDFGYNGDGKVANATKLRAPSAITMDKDGNLLFSDSVNYRVRKIDLTSEIVSTVAGNGSFGYSGDNGLATSAKMSAVRGLAVDNHGNIYIADFSNHRIRKVDSATGIITTVAGQGSNGFSGDGGLATNAKLAVPTAVAIGPDGHLYIADRSNNRIRKVDLSIGNPSSGTIATVVGGGSAPNLGDGGHPLTAKLNDPYGLAFDSFGNLFIADTGNHRIRKVTYTDGASPSYVDGIITTYTGTGSNSFSGDNGPASNAELNGPHSLTLDAMDNLYIVDKSNQRIRKVDVATGIITTVAGNGIAYSGVDWPVVATDTPLSSPEGVAVDGQGNFYIADRQNNRISKVTPGGYQIMGVPNNDDVGAHSVCVIANDGTDDSAEVCFTLTVKNTNDAPIATPQSLEATANIGKNIVLSGEDIDVGDTLSFEIVSAPTSGTISGTPPNITYTPHDGFFGSDSFTYRASDSLELSLPAVVAIEVLIDTDGDGAADLHDSDDDNDGILDTDELNDGTDPLLTDSDGDGYSAFLERRAGTNGNDINLFPTAFFTSSNAVDVVENATHVTRLAVDFAMSSVHFRVVGGADQALFNVNKVTGDLSFINPPDYELPSDSDANQEYVIQVQASDDKGSVSQVITVTVTDQEPEDNPWSARSRVNHSGELFLGGRYIELGISAWGDFGTRDSKPDNFFGTKARPSIGMSHDPDGFAEGAELGMDYFLPGSPEERFVVGYQDSTGQNYSSNSERMNAKEMNTTVVDHSNGENLAATIKSTLTGKMSVKQNITFNQDKAFFRNEVTISNISGENWTSARYMRSFDPDNTKDLRGAYPTRNEVLKTQENGDEQAVIVAKTYHDSDPVFRQNGSRMPIFFYSNDLRAKVSNFGFSNRDPYVAEAYANADAFGTTSDSDSAITITFDAGPLAHGQSAKFIYYTSLDEREFDKVIKDIIISYPPDDPLPTADEPVVIADMLKIDGKPVDLAMVGDNYLFIPTTTNSDGDALTYTIINKPSWATFDTVTGVLSGTPYVKDIGTYSDIKISVTDASGNKDELEAFSIVVKTTNSAPVLSGLPLASVDEEQGYSFAPVLSDPDLPLDIHRFSVANLPSWAAFDIATGRVSGTPSKGDAAVYSNIIISVTDRLGLTDTLAAFDITVNAANIPPTLKAGEGFYIEESTIAVGLIEVEDKDGDVLTYSLSGGVDTAHFNIDSISGELSFVSPPLFISPEDDNRDNVYELGVLASDGKGGDLLVSVRVTVLKANAAPTIVTNSGANVTENTINTLTLSQLEASDVDNDISELTYALVALPSFGELFIDNNSNNQLDDGELISLGAEFTQVQLNTGLVKYNHQSDQFTTNDSFEFALTDGEPSRVGVIGTFNFVIALINDPPVVSVADVSVPENTKARVLIDGMDPEGRDLRWHLKLGAPSWLSAGFGESIITTIAGDGTNDYFGDEGPANRAKLNYPHSVVIDNLGNIIVSDTLNHRIRKIDLQGNISTIVGNGNAGFSGDHGPATSAQLNNPYGLAIDNDGNLYFADILNNRIRKVDTNDVITTVAGIGGAGFGGDGGPAVLAELASPKGISVDDVGNLYIADSNNGRIRKVDTSGNITTIAGNGNHQFTGDNALAIEAELNYPEGVVVDIEGNIYIADTRNNVVRKIDINGIITTIAGNGIAGSSGDGGTATSAQLMQPNMLTFDGEGNIYIAETGSHQIRKVDLTGNISTVVGAGVAGPGLEDNALASSATLTVPSGIAVDKADNLYIVDRFNHRIRKSSKGKFFLTGTPTNADIGIHSVCVIAEDDVNQQTEKCFNITVTNVNDAPTALPQTMSLIEGNTLAVNLTGSDIDGDSLTYTVLSGPSNGTLSGSAPNLFYTPNVGYVGSDSLRFSVNDGLLSSSPATIDIVIAALPVNDVPTAMEQHIEVEQNASYRLQLIGNDSNNDSLKYIIVSNPSNGVLSGSGSNRTYTPNTDFVGNDSFTFKVNDGTDDSSSAKVSIVVNLVNNAPVAVDDLASVLVNSNDNLIAILANDTDADNDLLVVINASASQGSVVVNSDSTLGYTPITDFIGHDTISYQISDGKGGSATALVNVEVVAQENLPPIANDDTVTLSASEQVIIDVLENDTDPESDELSVVSVKSNQGETAIIDNHIVFSPSASSGQFLIEYSIVDTAMNMASAQVIVNIDSGVGPEITLPKDLCGEFTVNANALYTRVDLGQASAVDRFGNVIPVSLVDGVSLFPPGLNKAAWQATDANGHTSISIQKVCVMPLVSISKDQRAAEGNQVSFTIHLNGSAPVYPVTIPLEVGGSAGVDDHDLALTEVTIKQGTEVSVDINISDDDAEENDENIIVQLSQSLNLGNKSRHIISISESNIPPQVSLALTQQDEDRLIVTPGDGEVTIYSHVIDADVDDIHNYVWSADDEVVNLSLDEDIFRFDPRELPVGLYMFNLEVSDSGAPAKVDTATIYIEVVASLPTLGSGDSDGDLIPDEQEGYGDSDGDGIPDYLDSIEQCNVLQERADTANGYLIEGQPGVCLRRGEFTTSAESGGAYITDNDLSDLGLVNDEDATNVGGIFDYIAYGMPVQGDSFAIVMPQRNPIPENAVYRKYNKTKGWHHFIQNDDNSLWSTQGEPGYCPPPNIANTENLWTEGLTAGHWCVQMLIEDGGENDDDNQANGTIVDPGYVGTILNANRAPMAADDYAQLLLNNSITLDVLANDVDADNDVLTITSAVASIGEVAIEHNKLLYMPPSNYNGSVTITYGISDGNGGSGQAQTFITIIPNLAPEVFGEQSRMIQGESVSLNVLENDSDPEKDNLILVSVESDRVSFNSNGQVTFIPKAEFYGVVTIDYTVSDTAGNQAKGQWQITVNQLHIVPIKSQGGGALNFWLLLFSLTMIFVRKREG